MSKLKTFGPYIKGNIEVTVNSQINMGIEIAMDNLIDSIIYYNSLFVLPPITNSDRGEDFVNQIMEDLNND